MAMIMTPKSQFTGEVASYWSLLNLKTQQFLTLIKGDAYKDHSYYQAHLHEYITSKQRIYNDLLREWEEMADELKMYRLAEVRKLRQETTVTKQSQSASPYIIANLTSD